MPVHQRRILLFSCMVISTALFILLAFNLNTPWLLTFSEQVQSYLYDSLGSVGGLVFIVITYIGSAYVSFPILGILVIIFLYQKRYWTTLLLVVNLIGVRQLNWLLKSIFDRPRPDLEHLVEVSSASFPSGHSMNSIAFFGFLAFLLHQKLKGSGQFSRWVWISAVVLIGFIGLSRVYLGVHYPLDVIGGFLGGGAWLLFSILLYTYIPKKERFDR